MKRAYYSNKINVFIDTNPNLIIGEMVAANEFTLEKSSTDAWIEEIKILQTELRSFNGKILFEFAIPRMGKRIDTILIIGPVIFVIEFKVGERSFMQSAIDQVWDYALDLKNFHVPSHQCYIAPILIPTNAQKSVTQSHFDIHKDKVFKPIKSSVINLGNNITQVLAQAFGNDIDYNLWEIGSYSPSPTILEAALSLYKNHSVEDITRRDASVKNLNITSNAITEIIKQSETTSEKSICFITGVPGSGKTLVGLNTATKHTNKITGKHSVFLSGNGPLVSILKEALARDKIQNGKNNNLKITKKEALSEINAFIQIVHHYRDAYLIDDKAPSDHVAIFDEAQRAWNLQQTASFMHRKKKIPNFNQSEPEFLISCQNRHKDWAVIICLVGGGQEINTGEAGISEWINSIIRSYPDWHVYISPHLTGSEYGAMESIEKLKSIAKVSFKSELHLGVSLRSFRAENLSLLIKQILDLEQGAAIDTYQKIKTKYPITITRDIRKAKKWLKDQSRGTQRYGIVVSSQAERLKPHAIDVKSPMNPVHWFLEGKNDVRSSYYLEDVATEFDVQGLELDWTCVTWDADFQYHKNGWIHKSFRGSKWQSIKKMDRQNYLKNAYRVLLTRARQGMVIVVPEGDPEDLTRKNEYYDPTFEYLKGIGFSVL